jgi:3-ketosteroid 9alpha-monooxygenase subunit A
VSDIDSKLAASTDARTAPVAVQQVLSQLKGEELKTWRVAEVRNRPSADERGIDLPFPLGWFAIGYVDELPVGEARPIRYFGRELVMWRGEDGQVRVLDAYCRHLGAHMGHGGRVVGNLIECPFHAWRYDGEGIVREIPYARAIPPQVKRPCAHQWVVEEANGLIWTWYHPFGEKPQWALEHYPETSNPEWTPYQRYEWFVYAPLQSMAENGVDSAHFQFVHGTAGFPDAEIFWDGHRRSGVVSAKMGTPTGEVDGRIVSGQNGAGQSYTRFEGISETLLVAAITPIDRDRVHARFAFTQPRAEAEGPGAGLARALIRDICKQFDQDKVIWDRQAYLAKAIICDGDGPIIRYRRYYEQFYAERAPVPAAALA